MDITQGDTHSFYVTVKDANDVLLDLTGYTMTFTAKDSPYDTDGNSFIQENAVISTPSSGVGTFVLTPTVTNITVGDYYFDVQISDGGANVITVIKKDTLTITDQITIAS